MFTRKARNVSPRQVSIDERGANNGNIDQANVGRFGTPGFFLLFLKHM